MSVQKDRAAVRAAITEKLGARRMSAEQLQDELRDVATPSIVKRELLNLVGAGIVCSRETSGRTDEYETWERALKRLRDKRGGRPRDTVKPRGRAAVRIA